MRYKEDQYLDGIHTAYGWNPNGWDGRLSGEYRSAPRFADTDSVDRENLVQLVGEVRRVGTTPLFIVMPMHPSFWRVHEPAMSRIFAEFDRLAKQEGVDLIYPKRDYGDPRLFVDGHHMSHRGAAYFSRDIAPALLPYIQPER